MTRRTSGAVALVVGCALLASSCSTFGSDEPVPTTFLTSLEPLTGFGSGTLVVNGDREWPVMVADSSELRRRGLMGVTDLGPWAGMVFVWDEPVDGGFWMKHTLIPLTIYWFGDDGHVVATAQMVPCPPGDDCPRWTPGVDYTHALEIPTGTESTIGLDTIISLELG